MPRAVQAIPDSVSLDNLTTEVVSLDGLAALEPSETGKVIDMTKYDDSGIIPGASPKARLWQAIVGAYNAGIIDGSGDSVAFSSEITAADALVGGDIQTESNALRKGLPGYVNDVLGPQLLSLTIPAGSAYVDVLFDSGVFPVGTPAAVAATGSIVLGVQPTDGDTVVISDGQGNTVTFEFDDNDSVTGTEVDIGASTADTATALRAAINASALEITAGGTGSTVTLTNDNADALGNQPITVSGSTPPTVSGMSGGRDATISTPDLELVFTQGAGSATAAVISSIKKNDNASEGSASALEGGETTLRVFLDITGTVDGGETIAISPTKSRIRDAAGNVAPDLNSKSASLVAA